MSGNASRIQGVQFENIIKIHASHQDIHVEDMPIGARRIGKNKLIQIPTRYDMILCHNGIAVFIDAKSYDSDRLCYSNITQHQAKALARVLQKGFLAGYLCWHRPSNVVIFYRADKLLNLTPGQSLSPLDGIYLGTFENICLGTLFT